MKLHVCDYCLGKGVLTQATHKRRIKNHMKGNLEIHVCPKHNLKSTIEREEMQKVLIEAIKICNQGLRTCSKQ